MANIEVLLAGFPGRSSRGFLGWSGCYLVTTGRGRHLLFDTAGYNERATLVALLAERGLKPAQIDAVVLSHLHFDHAANWDLFPGADIFVHEEELAYAASEQADGAVLRYPTPALRAHPRLCRVSGDGSMIDDGVQLAHVPGHTPGSMALVVEGSVLCGDALKNRWDLGGQVPLNSWNLKLARRAIERLTGLGQRLFPGHDVSLERQGSTWRACGTPSVRVFFPDGSEQALEAPTEEVPGRTADRWPRSA